MESPQICFRRYEAKDLPRCTEITESTWPVGDWVAAGPSKTTLIESYVAMSLGNSNWTEVACEGEKAVGLLFAEIRPKSRKSFVLTALLAEISLYLGAMARGDFKRLGGKWLIILSFILTELKAALRMPRTDAYVNLFIVDPAFRGRSIGRMLMERFVEGAKKMGAASTALYTDDTSCNWGFYERFGFKKINTFHDTGGTFYFGKRTTGLVYILDLKSRIRGS